MNATSGTASKGHPLPVHDAASDPGDALLQLQFDDGSGLQHDPGVQRRHHADLPAELLGVADVGHHVHQLHLLHDLHRPGPGDRGGRGGERDLPPDDPESGNPSTGAVYQATLNLSSGKNDFAFYATDGTNEWSDPMTPGTYNGLTVSNQGRGRGPCEDPGTEAGRRAVRLRPRVSNAGQAGRTGQPGPTGPMARPGTTPRAGPLGFLRACPYICTIGQVSVLVMPGTD